MQDHVLRAARWLPAVAAAALATTPTTRAADPEKIQLSTGEVISVEVTTVSEESVTFMHPVLGEVHAARADVTLLDRIDAEAGTPHAADEAQAEEPLTEASLWKSRITAGGGYETGNTDTRNLNIQFKSTRETEETKLTFDSSYFYAESSGEQDTNRFTAGVNMEWLNPGSRWFYFANTRYTFDEEKDWRHRAQIFGGVGYNLIIEEEFFLNGRFGGGFTKEWDVDADRPELLIGVDGGWKINDHLSLTFDSTFFPDLNNTGEFRNVNNLACDVKLDDETPLSLTAGLQHEYESDVNEPTKKNDLRVFAGLTFEF